MTSPKEDHQVRFLQSCCCSSNCLVSSMINRLELDPTKTLHLLLHQLTIKTKLHLPTLLAVNVLHCFLINMNPFFLTLFSIWAFHRTVVQKRPLFNMNKWRRNFSTHC